MGKADFLLEVKVEVRGIGGATPEGALSVFDEKIRPLFSDKALVEVGLMEACFGGETFAAPMGRIMSWEITAFIRPAP